MRTLADLKRDLKTGTKLVLKSVDNMEKNENRTVLKVGATDICFLKDGGGKSYLETPKASLLDYDGKTIKIYRAGIRDLTDDEKQVMADAPEDGKQDEIDMISDGNVMFRRRKRYYEETGKEYLFGTCKKQGKRLTHKDDKDMIEDDNIKGSISIVYEIEQVKDMLDV